MRTTRRAAMAARAGTDARLFDPYHRGSEVLPDPIPAELADQPPLAMIPANPAAREDPPPFARARIPMVVQAWARDEQTIDRRFAAFHAAHPDVYEALVALCRQARATGRRSAGIGMLWEVLRWNRLVAGLPDPGEKRYLNDHYRSRYARMIMAAEPDLRGIFETRTLRSP